MVLINQLAFLVKQFVLDLVKLGSEAGAGGLKLKILH